MAMELETIKDPGKVANVIRKYFDGEALNRKLGLRADLGKKVASVVVTGSSFSDPGDDWCEYALMDEADNVLASRRIQGY